MELLGAAWDQQREEGGASAGHSVEGVEVLLEVEHRDVVKCFQLRFAHVEK
jgi:hypothetical protein